MDAGSSMKLNEKTQLSFMDLCVEECGRLMCESTLFLKLLQRESFHLQKEYMSCSDFMYRLSQWKQEWFQSWGLQSVGKWSWALIELVVMTRKYLYTSCLLSKTEVRCWVQGPTSVLILLCGVQWDTYPCEKRGVELERFGAKQWWAESRVTQSTRWQEYLFSSACPGLVVWLGITWREK